MAKLTAAQYRLLNICKEKLDEIMRSWTNDIEADPESAVDGNIRIRLKDRPMIDKAIDKMTLELLNSPDKPFGARAGKAVMRDGKSLMRDMKALKSDLDAIRKPVYIYAANAYVQTYLSMPASSKRAGRPRTPDEELRMILRLRGQKKFYKDICIAMHKEPTPANCDLMRHRFKEAKKRFGGRGV